MPDYSVYLTNDDDFVMSESRGTVPGRRTGGGVALLDHGDYEADWATAPGWNVYQIECEWRTWYADKKTAPKRPGAHFVRFCKSWFERKGSP